MTSHGGLHKLPFIPKTSLMYLGVGSGILLLTAAMLIIWHAVNFQNRKAQKALEIELSVQKFLHPSFNRLKQQALDNFFDRLRKPANKPFDRKKIGGLSALFREKATASGLVCTKSDIDLQTLNKDENVLLIYLILEGDFFRFRYFLTQIYHLPYLAKIEEIAIDSESKPRSYKLKVWIALK